MAKNEYFPSVETAERIKSCVRAGISSEERIAKICKITEKQLTNHYHYELGYTDDEDLAVVADVGFEMASCGKFPHMTIWWLKQKGSIVWQDKKDDDVVQTGSPLVIVVKGDS